MNAFHQRIEFCLKVHNEAVKAMRYPPKKYNEELETAQVRQRHDSIKIDRLSSLS
jgi:26S proteasome regulatory subunit N3